MNNTDDIPNFGIGVYHSKLVFPTLTSMNKKIIWIWKLLFLLKIQEKYNYFLMFKAMAHYESIYLKHG